MTAKFPDGFAGQADRPQPPTDQPDAKKDNQKPSTREKLVFLLLILFVFGVPSFSTLPIAHLVPDRYLLTSIVVIGFLWLVALIYFGEIFSRGVPLPIPTEGMLTIATFFLTLAVWGLAPLKQVGYLWVSAFVIISGTILKLCRARASSMNLIELIVSLLALIAAFLVMWKTRYYDFIGIFLIVVLSLYWLVASPSASGTRRAD